MVAGDTAAIRICAATSPALRQTQVIQTSSFAAARLIAIATLVLLALINFANALPMPIAWAKHAVLVIARAFIVKMELLIQRV